MTTQSHEPACAKCGSTVIREYRFGLTIPQELPPHVRLAGCVIDGGEWETQCLSCGQRRYPLSADDDQWATAVVADSGVAQAVQQYAILARETLGASRAPVVSYAGLWLLLAHVAPVATDAARIANVLGLGPDEARRTAQRLLDAAHPTLAATFGAWLAQWATLSDPLPVALDQLPGQAGLDRWARENTRGLIEAFPVTITADTMLVMASAVVLTPRWRHSLDTDRDGMLVLDDGLQAIVETRSAGPVAVAKPFTEDGIDVVSVIAAEDVPAPDIWRAVDEVVAQLESGQLWDNDHPGDDLTDGHAWKVRDTVESFLAGEAPPDGTELWRSHLPRWSARCLTDMRNAPGVEQIAQALSARVAEPSEVTCVQSARADYDEDGFRAAAVTAMEMRVTGMPQFTQRRIRRVQITFDRPHALIAIARGGPWEGVPVFNAWVNPATRAGLPGNV